MSTRDVATIPVLGIAGLMLFGAATAEADPASPAAQPVSSRVWVAPQTIPMNSTYHWRAASPTNTAKAAFLSTRLCGTPRPDLLPPAAAIATQTGSVSGSSVVQSAGQWPGDPTDSTSKAAAFQNGIEGRINMCPGINQVQSIDLRPAPEWFGFAATLLVGDRDNPSSEIHIYNVVPPESSAISELAVTVPRTSGQPSPWQPVDDATVMRALAQPLCRTSC